MQNQDTDRELRILVRVSLEADYCKWWFGHLERMGKNNWIRWIMGKNVERGRGKGRPRKTWREVTREDLGNMG